MKNRLSFQAFLLMLIVITIFTASCAPASTEIANPASEFCEENGGKVEIRDGDDGEYGVCIFPDGSECDEWEYVRGQCKPASEETQSGLANPASVYCLEQGGTLEIRETNDGQIGFCLFDDGSECEEWAFFRGECAIGGAKMLPPTEPEENVITSVVFVTQTEVMIAESYPVQISLKLTGEMPTPCDQLQAVISPPDEVNNIMVALNAWQEDNGLACAQVMTPFISIIDIPTVDLADGTYTLWVDGIPVGTFEYPG